MRWPDGYRADPVREAARGAHREGETALASLGRLLAASAEGAPDDGSVRWQVWLSRRREGADDLELRLSAQASLHLPCARCLGPVRTHVEVDRRFRLVPDESQAAALDAHADDHDVLWLEPGLDLAGLLEDELLLALPMLPRHERCPDPLAPGQGGDDVPRDASAARDDAARPSGAAADTVRPFADLAERLKRPRD